MRVLWELEARITRERYSPAITRVLQGIVDDIGAIRGKYPELAGWDLSAPQGSGFYYRFRLMEPATKTSEPRFGEHGCTISVTIVARGEKFQRHVQYGYAGGRLAAHVEIMTGPEPSPGFEKKIRSICGRHHKKLSDPPGPPAPLTAPRGP